MVSVIKDCLPSSHPLFSTNSQSVCETQESTQTQEMVYCQQSQGDNEQNVPSFTGLWMCVCVLVFL